LSNENYERKNFVFIAMMLPQICFLHRMQKFDMQQCMDTANKYNQDLVIAKKVWR
jgi:hypothetical protein